MSQKHTSFFLSMSALIVLAKAFEAEILFLLDMKETVKVLEALGPNMLHKLTEWLCIGVTVLLLPSLALLILFD